MHSGSVSEFDLGFHIVCFHMQSSYVGLEQLVHYSFGRFVRQMQAFSELILIYYNLFGVERQFSPTSAI